VSANLIPVATFRLGRIVATANALTRLNNEDILTGIQRHQAGDWGDVGDDDRRENELSLEQGFRLLSVYHATNGVKFWIITEVDRKIASSDTIIVNRPKG